MERVMRCGIRSRLLVIIAGFSVIELLLHLYTNMFAGYGIFRDELYYIACSKRLALGYVDQPPLSIYILTFSRFLFGDSIFAIRFLPAVASAFTVFFTGLTLNELKGNTVAVVAASLSLIFSPIFLGMCTIFSMNAFDWLAWSALFYLTARLINTDNPKLWIAIGLLMGLGLLNKIDISWFCAGLLIGLLLTSQRKHLATFWPYLSGLIALLVFLPYIIWNATHNFADLEFIRNASALKYASVTRLDLITGQILENGPLTLPVWLAGIYFYFFTGSGNKFRLIGLIFLTTFLILFLNGHSKPEYLSPTITVLFAGGGMMVEKLTEMRYARWTRTAVPVFLLVGGIIGVPAALPILPVDTYIKYEKAMGLRPSIPEAHHLEELPQFYADMFGWENMARSVSKVYTSLPVDEQKRAIVFAINYGEAGAIDFFKNKYPLPNVICPHNNFWYWGYGDTTKDIVIAFGTSREDFLKSFSSVTPAATIQSEYAIPYENNLPVFVCRGIRVDIKEVWSKIKFFI